MSLASDLDFLLMATVLPVTTSSFDSLLPIILKIEKERKIGRGERSVMGREKKGREIVGSISWFYFLVWNPSQTDYTEYKTEYISWFGTQVKPKSNRLHRI